MSSTLLSDDPDKLLNEWLGELENLIGGLEVSTAVPVVTRLRPHSQTSSERTDSYRFSMANLEETHEAELDAILGELSLLEQRGSNIGVGNGGSGGGGGIVIGGTTTIAGVNAVDLRHGRTHSRSNSAVSAATNSTISTTSSSSESGNGSGQESALREPRTESPDNDSAFSDTVSLLSSESSASSSTGIVSQTQQIKNLQINLSQYDSTKAAKIHLALQKLEQASVKRIFVKAFSSDGASKSLLVDERMTCGHITRLLADKNHVQMEPHWALVEQLPELQMERLFEDHELLVENLLMWSIHSKNRVMFLQRPDKVSLFIKPEVFLPGIQMAPGSDHDEHTRAMLLEEFFTTGSQITMEGPLYLKSDTKKGWKRYHFVLRASGLYYYPKEKTKSPKDLICLALFTGHEVYKGIGWKKKHKAPTEYTFAMRSPKAPLTSKTARSLKMLCAEDIDTLEKWVTAIRIAKYGKRILDNHKLLLEDLAREELDKLSSARSGSINSIVSSVPSQCSTGSNNSNGNVPPPSSGRLSRASSSSSSGCLSDENNGFDCEFPTGTIKRKPSMKPNLPLTSMTRQLKEVGETTVGGDSSSPTSPERGGTLTRRHSRRRSEESNGSGTLKRRPIANRGSIESMSSSNSTPTPTPSIPGTPCSNNQPIFINVTPVSDVVAINQNNLNNNMSICSSNNNTTTTTLNNNCNNNNNNNNNNNSGNTTPLETMPSCMTDSTFSLPPPPDDLGTALSGSMLSLDSLPLPPPPCELEINFSGSQMSLVSLPPPPPEINSVFTSPTQRLPPPTVVDQVEYPIQQQQQQQQQILPREILQPHTQQMYSQTLPNKSTNDIKIEAQPIYSKTMKTSVLKSPPYKAPPPYNGTTNGAPVLVTTPPVQKTVTFADSPVLLRRKVCFEDQVQQVPPSPRRSIRDSNAPPPPPRAEATRLSTTFTSPKRLSDSTSNPPRDFLKDLQRVMRKKWQVAQKCKLEPTTTPHEVLGFRDFNGEFHQIPANGTSTHYYRETVNVSNWVQEHYGPDSLYENLGADMGIEPAHHQIPAPSLITMKKRPPPPPPKRSESTHLTNRAQ